jgi:hypothetical protein
MWVVCRRVLMCCWLLVACSEEHSVGTSGELGLGVRDESCERLDLNQCAANSGCGVIHGQLVEEARQCIGDDAKLGCKGANVSCGEALTIATDREGRAWWFSNTCTPASFEQLPGLSGSPQVAWVNWPACNPPTPQRPASCADLVPDHCEQGRPDCVGVRATAFDTDRRCVRGPKIVMCIERSRGCASTISYARDPEGLAWAFTSVCRPATWAVYQPAPEATPTAQWPGCTN